MKLPLYHILNGDALRARFPNAIEGQQLIMRECLIEGNVEGENLNHFFKNRAAFIQSAYGIEEEVAHYQQVITEFDKMQEIPEGAKVYLWFEDDLFCQVNLWFVLYLLSTTHRIYHYYLVRPNADLRYGFGGMDTQALQQAYEHALALNEPHLGIWQHLWKYYQNQQYDQLNTAAKHLAENFPWLVAVVEAEIERESNSPKMGRPERTLQRLMAEHPQADFATLFNLFSQQEAIYGFGDLQVKKMLEQLSS